MVLFLCYARAGVLKSPTRFANTTTVLELHLPRLHVGNQEAAQRAGLFMVTTYGMFSSAGSAMTAPSPRNPPIRSEQQIAASWMTDTLTTAAGMPSVHRDPAPQFRGILGSPATSSASSASRGRRPTRRRRRLVSAGGKRPRPRRGRSTWRASSDHRTAGRQSPCRGEDEGLSSLDVRVMRCAWRNVGPADLRRGPAGDVQRRLEKVHRELVPASSTRCGSTGCRPRTRSWAELAWCFVNLYCTPRS